MVSNPMSDTGTAHSEELARQMLSLFQNETISDAMGAIRIVQSAINNYVKEQEAHICLRRIDTA